jgi:hypothetical protein
MAYLSHHSAYAIWTGASPSLSAKQRRREQIILHKNPFRRDAEATKAMHFASKYSYVSRRIHPGSDHPCVYLAGLEDIEKRRLIIFTRDKFSCVDCGAKVSWDTGHLAHGGHTKISRCDCLENLKTKCHECHKANDHHGRDF